MGDINSLISQYERKLEKEDDHNIPIANSMLVLMVKGLFSSLAFPYAQFPCCTVKGNQLYPILWEAISRLELSGFRVLGLTCDGLAANRRLFHLHTTEAKSFIHKVENPFSHPSLLRNAWASHRRNLWNGGDILRSHLWQLYYGNRSSQTPGLTLVPKLKFEHVHLTSFSKMRVDLAAQV